MVKSLAHRRSAVVPEALDERRFESSRPTIRKEKAETMGQSANKQKPSRKADALRIKDEPAVRIRHLPRSLKT